MARKVTRNLFTDRTGRRYVRVTIAPNERRAYALPEILTDEQADKCAGMLVKLASQMRGAGSELEITDKLLERAAAAGEGAGLAAVTEAIDMVCTGDAEPINASPTFEEIGERWTSGALAREYPDHIRPKLSAVSDAYRLKKHVYPHVVDLRIADFTLDHAERVMSRLPADPSSAGTRRQVAQLMSRILAMAVFPLRLIKVSPFPRGFLPKPAPKKAQGYVYPDEDRTLLACIDVPLCWRVLFGFLHREGMRSTEATRLIFAHLDLERGAIRLDKNKTHDARAWPLAPGVAGALRALKKLRGAGDEDPVFVNQQGGAIRDNHLAEKYRATLRAAGVTRAELFENSAERNHIVLHSTRSAFVTVSLASGWPEAKVADRTGHKSSGQITRYRRQARTVEELDLGAFTPLDEAIPELSGAASTGPLSGGRRNGRREGEAGEGDPPPATTNASDYATVRRKGLEPLQELPHWNLKKLSEMQAKSALAWHMDSWGRTA